MGFSEKKITIDFSRIKKAHYYIKSESSYNANLSNGCLKMALKKSNYIAWVDIVDKTRSVKEYHDHIIQAKIRLDNLDGYAAAGIIFHNLDDTTYYLALMSSKGYFRLDSVKDGAPNTLIAWTEIADFDITNINLKIITYGTNLVFLINEKWIGEVSEEFASYGRLGFALASYSNNNEQLETDSKDEDENEEQTTGKNDFTCFGYLNFITIDTRTKTIIECYNKCTDDSNINAEERLRLAETFAVMGEAAKSLDQINRAWKRRDEAIRSLTAGYSEVRTRKELLLAARMSFHLRLYSKAEMYINSIFDQGLDSPESKMAIMEKIKILNELNRFEEIKELVIKHAIKINKDIDYYILIARCYWELKEYKNSAEAWDKAFEMNNTGNESEDTFNKQAGVFATNAASAHENAGNNKEALARYIEAGKIFLKQDNKAELEAIMPKLSALGSKNWEARTLAGKWAYSIEAYDKSAEDFAAANKLRNLLRPRPPADPAAYYLWALVLNLKGKIKEAIKLLEKTVELAPDYGLFRFKLAEIKLKSGIKDPAINEEFKLALKQIGKEDAELANYLANSLGT